MLGFDALGRLALGQVDDGGGATNFPKALAANVDARATAIKALATAKFVLVSAAAFIAAPVDRVQALMTDVAASVLLVRNPGKLAVVGGVASSGLRRDVFADRSASVSTLATALKSIVLVKFVAAVSSGAVAVKTVAKVATTAVSVFVGFLTEAFNIISRRVLHDPVDYFMEGLPQYREKGQTYEPGRGRPSEDVKVLTGGRRRLTSTKPTFTTRTDKRGYD